MRNIYLIRHCEPFQDGKSRCLSQTDERLSEVGKEQTESLKKWFARQQIDNVYSSPLRRCMETAAKFGKRVNVLAELTEMSVGEWEGRSFEEIEKKWPEIYEARGRHLGTVPPPGGESFVQAGNRLESALKHILEKTEGDVAVVTHSGILRGWLCRKIGISPDDVFTISLPCGSITRIFVSEEGYKVGGIGYKPNMVPGIAEIESIFKKYKTPANVILHGYAVAKKAIKLAEGNRYLKIDTKLLFTASLLHDFCRPDGRNHPIMAAEILKKSGYPILAEIIEQHHDLRPDASPEAEILYLADRLVKGIKEITLTERFQESRKKCVTEEAYAAWKKRYEDSFYLMDKYGVSEYKTDLAGAWAVFSLWGTLQKHYI